jgi:micrococcal nuclease
MLVALLACATAHVVDGDTIRCSAVGRVRMIAIDAADKPSSRVCRLHIGNHTCDAVESTSATISLVKFTEGKKITYRQMGYDFRNKRITAQMFANGVDLQCYQLKMHHARYFTSYDRRAGYPILHRCRSTVRHAVHAD